MRGGSRAGPSVSGTRRDRASRHRIAPPRRLTSRLKSRLKGTSAAYQATSGRQPPAGVAQGPGLPDGARHDRHDPPHDGTTTPDPGAHHGGGAGHVGGADLDAIAAAAAAAGLTGPTTITPGEAGRAWSVEQVDNTWPLHKDKIAVHPATGQIVDTIHWADQPLLSKLTTAGIMIHMGVLFGPANQIALALIAAGLVTVIVWGYRMWWRRRPTRDQRRIRLGAPPARGTWRHLPMPALVMAVPAAAAIGWAVPLLGWPLLGFIVIDAFAGFVIRRRNRPAAAVPR